MPGHLPRSLEKEPEQSESSVPLFFSFSFPFPPPKVVAAAARVPLAKPEAWVPNARMRVQTQIERLMKTMQIHRTFFLRKASC